MLKKQLYALLAGAAIGFLYFAILYFVIGPQLDGKGMGAAFAFAFLGFPSTVITILIGGQLPLALVWIPYVLFGAGFAWLMTAITVLEGWRNRRKKNPRTSWASGIRIAAVYFLITLLTGACFASMIGSRMGHDLFIGTMSIVVQALNFPIAFVLDKVEAYSLVLSGFSDNLSYHLSSDHPLINILLIGLTDCLLGAVIGWVASRLQRQKTPLQQ